MHDDWYQFHFCTIIRIEINRGVSFSLTYCACVTKNCWCCLRSVVCNKKLHKLIIWAVKNENSANKHHSCIRCTKFLTVVLDRTNVTWSFIKWKWLFCNTHIYQFSPDEESLFQLKTEVVNFVHLTMLFAKFS